MAEHQPPRSDQDPKHHLRLADALRSESTIRTSWADNSETVSIMAPGFKMDSELVGAAGLLLSSSPVLIKTESGRRYATDFFVAIELPAWNQSQGNFGPASTPVSASHIGRIPQLGTVEVGKPYALGKRVGDDTKVTVVTISSDPFVSMHSSPELEEVFNRGFINDSPYTSTALQKKTGIENPVLAAGRILDRVVGRYRKEDPSLQRAIGNILLGSV